MTVFFAFFCIYHKHMGDSFLQLTLCFSCVAVKWASVIIQFVVSCVMSVVGIVYIIMGFIPTVSKLYRPIFGDPKCRTANVVVASEEYWYGKEKFDAKYGVADMQKDPTAATAPHMQPGFNGGAAAQQAQFS